MRYIDLFIPIANNMQVYPVDPAVEVIKQAYLKKDGADHTSLKMCVHNGTHACLPMPRICRVARFSEKQS